MSNSAIRCRPDARRLLLRGSLAVVALGLSVVAPSAATAEDTVETTIANASGATVAAGVVISPDGTRAYVLGPGAGAVSVIDTTATPPSVTTISQPNTNFALALSPDGTRLYLSQSAVDAVGVVDTTTTPPTFLPSIPVGDNPTGLAITPDGTRVYVANTNVPAGGNTLSIINTATSAVTGNIAGSAGPRAVVASPDGSRVYVANAVAISSSVTVINTTTNTFVNIPTGASTNQLRSMVFSADGTRIYATRPGTNSVVIIDNTTNPPTFLPTTITVGTSPTGIAVTPDGTRIYVTNTTSNTVSVISTARIGTALDPVIDTIDVGQAPRGIAITPDGRHAYVANTTSQTVSVIAIDTFPEIVTTTTPDGTAGTPYSTHIDVSGSPTPDTTLETGTLPPGLTIAPNGDLTGTPSTAGTFTFTLKASSDVSVGIPASDTQEYTIEIAAVLPDAPLTLTAQTVGNAIDLGWTAPTFDGGTPITGYRIERSTNSGPFDVLVADTATTDTSRTDTDVQPGNTYTYRVYALTTTGQSPASNEADATIAPAVATTQPTITTTTTSPITTDPASTQPLATTTPTPPDPTAQPPAPASVPELPTTGTNSRSQLLTAGAALLLGVVLLLGGRNRRSLRSREH